MTDSRVTRQGIEALTEGDADSRLTRQGIEALTEAPSDSRVVRQGIEALTEAPSDSRVVRQGIEVLAGLATSAGGARLVAVGQRTASGATGTAFLRLPPHKAGDIVLIHVAHREAAQAGGVDVDGFTQKTDHQNGLNSFQLWWRRAAADAEANPVIDHTFAAGATWHAMVVRGAVDAGDPFDAAASANVAALSLFTFPDLTTTADDELILHLAVTQSTPTWSNWRNDNVLPRQFTDRGAPSGNGGVTGAFGHKVSAGAIGSTTVNASAPVNGAVASYAFLNGAAVTDTASTFRDSILSSGPADNSQITLPTHQAGDYICAIITGSDQTKTFAATLSGFTKVLDVPAPQNGRPFSIHKLIAASGAETNPTIDHTFVGGDVWSVVIFSITGELTSFLWDGGTNTTATNDVEVASPATVVGYANSTGAENWTSFLMEQATSETEVEDGGGNARLGLYTAVLEAEGNIGIAQPVVQFGSGQNWAVLAFSEEVAIPPVTGTIAVTQADQTAAFAGTVTNPGGGGGGGGASGTQAVRRGRRRRARR